MDQPLSPDGPMVRARTALAADAHDRPWIRSAPPRHWWRTISSIVGGAPSALADLVLHLPRRSPAAAVAGAPQ